MSDKVYDFMVLYIYTFLYTIYFSSMTSFNISDKMNICFRLSNYSARRKFEIVLNREKDGQN